MEFEGKTALWCRPPTESCALLRLLKYARSEIPMSHPVTNIVMATSDGTCKPGDRTILFCSILCPAFQILHATANRKQNNSTIRPQVLQGSFSIVAPLVMYYVVVLRPATVARIPMAP